MVCKAGSIGSSVKDVPVGSSLVESVCGNGTEITGVVVFLEEEEEEEEQ